MLLLWLVLFVFLVLLDSYGDLFHTVFLQERSTLLLLNRKERPELKKNLRLENAKRQVSTRVWRQNGEKEIALL